MQGLMRQYCVFAVLEHMNSWTTMAGKITFVSLTILLFVTLTSSAPASLDQQVEIIKDNKQQIEPSPANEKEDLTVAASHWGGHYGGGHYGGGWGGYGGHWGGHYPHYGSYWGVPSYGYGYWPYGYYGHHGYWW